MGPKATGKHVCNLYDSPFNIDTICLLEKGLKYILNALRGRKTVPKSQIQDFCRKLRLKYLFTCSDIQTDKSLNSIGNLDLIQVASKMQLWKNGPVMHRDEEFDHYRNLYTSYPEAHSIVNTQWLSCLLLPQMMKILLNTESDIPGLV